MTVTYDLATNVGRVRLLINDKTGTQYSDEEIETFLDIEGNVVRFAAALALEDWAGTFADEKTEEQIGDYKYSKSSRAGGPAADMLSQAARYRKAEEDTPVFDWSEMDMTTYGRLDRL